MGDLLAIAAIVALAPVWLRVERWLVRRSGGAPTAPYLRRRP